MTERFKKAYDALVRAYFEGTLAKGTCVACACGNIIFSAVGKPITKEDFWYEAHNINIYNPKRGEAFALWGNKRSMRYGKWVPDRSFLGIVNEAGYTVEEFAEIENAFEGNTNISIAHYGRKEEQEILEDQYNGLCAVVDVLLELDEEKEDPDKLKKKFREHPKLVTV